MPGQYFDKETNNHYNYYRDYDTAIGRYMQSDPMGIVGGLNGYAYVDSNPLAFADSLGDLSPNWQLQFLPRATLNQLANIMPYINNPVQAQLLIRSVIAANQYRIALNILAQIAARGNLVGGAAYAGYFTGQQFNSWFQVQYCQPFGGAIFDALNYGIGTVNRCPTEVCNVQKN